VEKASNLSRQLSVEAADKLASETGEDGHRLVQFGDHRDMSWSALCESDKAEHVRSIRKQTAGKTSDKFCVAGATEILSSRSVWDMADIHTRDEYMFPHTEMSATHISSRQAVQCVCMDAKVEHPEQIQPQKCVTAFQHYMLRWMCPLKKNNASTSIWAIARRSTKTYIRSGNFDSWLSLDGHGWQGSESGNCSLGPFHFCNHMCRR